MRLTFRKSFRLGPIRTTLGSRGITNSIGAGGLRLSSKPTKWGAGTGFLAVLVAALSIFL
jgi:hypothetical protein